MNPSNNRLPSVTALAWLIPAFAILEPVWMLSPFVGFLYGSVLNIHALESSRATAWLLLFVLPARGFIMPGLVLAVAGMSLFAVGACQVYAAKLFKKGMVTTAVYRMLRHPQYTGLILAAAGMVMMWGRFMAYISVFIMIYLYLLLSKKEEEICMAEYGSAYKAYSSRTPGLFPGADALFRIMSGMRPWLGSGGMTAALGFLLTLGLALGSGFSIIKARQAFSANAPLFQKKLTYNDRELCVVSPGIPYLDSSNRKGHFKSWMKHVAPDAFFEALESSVKIRDRLMRFYENGMNAVLMIFEPRLSVREEQGVTFFSFYMVPMEIKTGSAEMGINDLRKNARPLGMLRIEDMVAVSGTEPVQGDIRVVSAADTTGDNAVNAQIKSKVDVLLSRFY